MITKRIQCIKSESVDILCNVFTVRHKGQGPGLGARGPVLLFNVPVESND